MTARNVGSDVFDALGEDRTAPRWLVEILFDSGPLRVWNGLGPLVAAPGAGGVTKDATANANDGTLQGGVQWTQGLLGASALRFDGVDDFVELGAPPELQLTGALTVEAQVEVRGTLTGEHAIVRNGSGQPTSYVLFFDAFQGGSLKYQHAREGETTQNLLAPGVLGPGPHHIAAVRAADGVTVALYVDGAEVASGTLTSAPDGNSNGTTRIGAWQAGQQGFPGIVDDVRVWNVARTAQEIADNKDVELVGNEPGLVGYWKFNEGVTFTGAGRLGRVAPIRETQEIKASGAELSLLVIPTDEVPDAPDAILNLALAEDFQGRPVTLWQAQMDPDTGALIGEPFPRFKGQLDVIEDSEVPGAALIRVTVENRLVDLERPRRRTYTPEDQKAVHPGDTFFDEVAALQNREIILKERR